MAVSVELPQLGESVVEGTVSKWLVAPGDRVEIDQPLVEVTTDKVDAEIPSPAAGIVGPLLVPEGATVPVGAELVSVEADTGPAASKTSADVSPAAPPTPAVEEAAAPSEPAPLPHAAREATPVARRVAQEAHVDLERVEGTGGSGRVTKADVLRHAEATRALPAPEKTVSEAPRALPAYMTYSLQPGDRVVPLSPQRRLIAEHMVYSKQTSPHVGTVSEVDFGAVSMLRKEHKEEFQGAHGVALTYLPFVIHVVVRALREFPRLNSSLIDENIVEKQDIHVGMAVETDKGLVAPVIRHADRLSLAGIAMAIDDLSGRARSRKLSPDELRGGTFTVSNPGKRGNLYGFAIINQPQVGILRMGELKKCAVVRSLDGDDAIVIRPVMRLALSYDHRVVDGAPANGFLYRIRELLESAEFDL